jgi:hypothetical protein
MAQSTQGKLVKNYEAKLERHTGEESILAVVLRSSKEGANMWSFSSNWQLIFSSFASRKIIGDINIFPQLGYPFSKTLGKISRASFVEDLLLIATTCGHLIIFECLVPSLDLD